jgi:hypothetical protein
MISIGPIGTVGTTTREGCCAGWPKPCSYHEGWLDGWEAGYEEARRQYQGGGWGPDGPAAEPITPSVAESD